MPRLHAKCISSQSRLTGNTDVGSSRTSFAAASCWSAWLCLFSMATIWLTELAGEAAVSQFRSGVSHPSTSWCDQLPFVLCPIHNPGSIHANPSQLDPANMFKGPSKPAPPMSLVPRSGLPAGVMGILITAASGADCAVFDLAIFSSTGAGSSCIGKLHKITQCSTATGARKSCAHAQ